MMNVRFLLPLAAVSMIAAPAMAGTLAHQTTTHKTVVAKPAKSATPATAAKAATPAKPATAAKATKKAN